MYAPHLNRILKCDILYDSALWSQHRPTYLGTTFHCIRDKVHAPRL
jgi:hypothetical protein